MESENAQGKIKQAFFRVYVLESNGLSLCDSYS